VAETAHRAYAAAAAQEAPRHREGQTMTVLSLSPDARSDQPLWRVFWIYGVLASHVLFVAILYLYDKLSTPLIGLLFAAFVLYTAIITRSVWVSAGNTRRAPLGEIARFLTVAWALNAVLVSGFLFLDHLSTSEPRLPLPF